MRIDEIITQQFDAHSFYTNMAWYIKYLVQILSGVYHRQNSLDSICSYIAHVFLITSKINILGWRGGRLAFHNFCTTSFRNLY
jgi:hypothetical protein